VSDTQRAVTGHLSRSVKLGGRRSSSVADRLQFVIPTCGGSSHERLGNHPVVICSSPSTIHHPSAKKIPFHGLNDTMRWVRYPNDRVHGTHGGRRFMRNDSFSDPWRYI